jgi:hypothetical protein
MVEAAGFPAVATSSFATRILGYTDGEAARVEDALAAAARIVRAVPASDRRRRAWPQGTIGTRLARRVRRLRNSREAQLKAGVLPRMESGAPPDGLGVSREG